MARIKRQFQFLESLQNIHRQLLIKHEVGDVEWWLRFYIFLLFQL